MSLFLWGRGISNAGSMKGSNPIRVLRVSLSALSVISRSTENVSAFSEGRDLELAPPLQFPQFETIQYFEFSEIFRRFLVMDGSLLSTLIPRCVRWVRWIER